MSFKPDIPETPLYKSKPMISKEYKKETGVKVGNIVDNKEALVLAIRLKALDEGYQFLSKRKLPVLKLAETYRATVQEWYFKRRELAVQTMTFKVLLHHYGRFTSPPGRNFIDGLVATVDPVELDNFSTNQVKLILTNSLGYDFKSLTFLYVRNPNCSLDSGLIPLANAIQDRDILLTYTQTHQNRLHVYVSRVEISSLVMADQRKDERNKKENQGKPSCSKKEALDEEACLEEQILSLMHRFADRFTNRRLEIDRLNSLPDDPLIEYGRYALGCMTWTDMKKAAYLKSIGDELLRSMEEKRQFIASYKAVLFATLLKGEPSRKTVNFHTLLARAGNRADVAISLESVRVVHERLSNNVYGFFLGKHVAYSDIENYVKNTWINSQCAINSKKVDTHANIVKRHVCNIPVWVKFHDIPITVFIEDGLGAIATKLDTPMLIDSYTSTMCTNSRSTYVKAMVELRVNVELKDTLVVDVLKFVGLGHVLDECPKKFVSNVLKNLKNARQVVRGVQ
nr:hypothetical protein [Tanacetum cinerariifolium]